jgi:hypothetical protein
VVLAGDGETYFRYSRDRAEVIAQGLLAADPATIVDPKRLPSAPSASGSATISWRSLRASAARDASSRPDEMAQLPHPVLVVCGELDDTSGRQSRSRAHSRMAVR